MLSTLTLVSIFTEIFTAGLLIAGVISFVKKYLQENSRRDLYFGLVFFLLFVYVALIVASQMMFNLGRSLTELIWIHRFIAATTALCVFTLWLYLVSKFRFNKIRWIKYISGLVLISVLIVIYRIFRSAVSLVYREGVIEPIVDFSLAVPIKTLWLLIWFVLAIVAAWRFFTLKPSGRKNLTAILSISSLLMVGAYFCTVLYSNSGSGYYLLLSWFITLFAVVGLLLSEIIPPFSKVAAFPLSYFRTRILFKLILIFVLLIVILFEATTLIVISISKSSLSDSVISVHKSQVTEVVDKIESYIGTATRDLKIIAGTPALKSGDISSAKTTLNLLLNTNPVFDGLAVLNPSGNILINYAKTNAKLSAQDIDFKGMRLAFRREHGMYLSGLMRSSDGNAYLIAAVEVPSSGLAVVSRINLSVIQDVINKISYRGKGFVYVVDEKGKLIAHPDEIRAKSAEDLSEVPTIKHVLGGAVGGGEFYGTTISEKMVGAYMPVENLGWGVVVEEPLADAYFEIRRVETNSLMFVIMGIILTVTVGVFFARSIEKPIKDLIEGTDAVRQGDLNVRMEVETIDEIGTLTSAFNLMTKELRESQDRLILSEKLASLGTMAAGMAHEIKNPLVSLRTFTQLLQQKWGDEEYRKKFSQIVPHEIERINKIAESLLKFGKPMKPELTKVEVNQILEDVLLLFESEAKKNNIRVTTKFADLPMIIGDQGQLSQAFVNIILNAIQSMKKGGELTIKTDVGEVIHLGKMTGSKGKLTRDGNIGEMSFGEEEAKEKAEVIKPIGVVFVEISDSGEGIPADNLRSLFDPFFTTKMTGTGMGLPITLRIIEEHKGSVKVRSQIGKGTTFLITLPQNIEEQKDLEEKINSIT
ncbi:MAG: HAMP domain-containing protein [Candidatus Margulisbacteria bacterium]|nr:HAMP domain-containing protein [Candidatus Margulisiibacteriota bacterium]MBU1022473.1 HAMP domain-containing protein [Candidatus Margulisiibacteriota bacterium]MBU1728457.1 HAMP domain-containing protein [Candidatus Margulisiibacteriota bacterium]MBU1954604.1 HAMP domain-containing protein [Candidatus Margulisiibacteriota bacterium]